MIQARLFDALLDLAEEWEVHCLVKHRIFSLISFPSPSGAGGSIARGVTLPLLRAAACHEVERLGARLFPSDTCLPLAHVALRLEGLASRSWPPELWRAGGAESLGRDEGSAEGVACALVAACKGTWEHPVRSKIFPCKTLHCET